MAKSFLNSFPASQAVVGGSSINLNDVLSEGSIINLEDLVCLFNRKEVELTDEQIKEYASTGELPKDYYFVFKLIISNKDGNIKNLNAATYTLFNLDVKVGDKSVKLGDWAKRLNDKGEYDADMEVAEDAVIDFSKIGALTVQGFEDVFETRPTVIEAREAMPNFFKENIHFVVEKDGKKKHFKFASKDHDGAGLIMRNARDKGEDIDYAKIAKQPVLAGAKQLRVPTVIVS